jgi:hypothetical protein
MTIRGYILAGAVVSRALAIDDEVASMNDKIPTFDVTPHVGIGPVQLGMAREAVHGVMPGKYSSFRKAPDDKYETDAFLDSGFQVFYGGDSPIVEYIELSRDCGFWALYKGIDVFGSPANEMVTFVCGDAPFDPANPEIGFSYIFPDLEMSLWRPYVPESPDEEEGREFSTIGVDVKGYYSLRL